MTYWAFLLSFDLIVAKPKGINLTNGIYIPLDDASYSSSYRYGEQPDTYSSVSKQNLFFIIIGSLRVINGKISFFTLTLIEISFIQSIDRGYESWSHGNKYCHVIPWRVPDLWPNEFTTNSRKSSWKNEINSLSDNTRWTIWI